MVKSPRRSERGTVSSTRPGVRIEYVLSGLVLLFVLLTLYFVWVPPSSSGYVSATRLELVVPETAAVGDRVIVLVRAVDEQGRLDVKRSDIVDISVSPGAKVELSVTQVTLEKGQAQLTIVGLAPGTVTIIATWTSGYAFLDQGSASVTFGS